VPEKLPAPSPMSSNRYRWLVGGLLGAAAVALAGGIVVTDTSHPDDATQSEIVERLVPRANDEVLRQAELGIDLAPGYDGTLAVNGVDIPVEDQRRVPEQNEVFFTPGDGKAVEQLEAGPNCVRATVWKAADGPGTANDRTFDWCFEAT
jgi:hypothetical protein